MPIETVSETGSTNDDLISRAVAGAPEGLWLRAAVQTSGKGRQGRAWMSPPGNLYASTLVRLRLGDPPAPTLALVAVVALHEAVAVYAPDVRIKWPNDLVASTPAEAGVQPGLRPAPGHKGSAKLAGILLERSGDAVVIGFGVNLAHHPQDLDRPAISLAALTGTAPDSATFLEMLAESFARWLQRWRFEGIGPIRSRWLSAAHPIGTALSTSEGDGLFDGLDETGALRLRLADGSVRVVRAGDVFLI